MIHFDVTRLEKELKELEIETVKDGFWNDQKKYNIIISKIKSIKRKCEAYRKLEDEANNLKDLAELVTLEYDESLANDIVKNVNKRNEW